jgi:hypothetical protein
METVFNFLMENLYFFSIGLVFPLLGFFVDVRTVIDLIKGKKDIKISSSKNFIGSNSFDVKSFSTGAIAGVVAACSIPRPGPDPSVINSGKNVGGSGRAATSSYDEALDDIDVDDDVLSVHLNAVDEVAASSDLNIDILDWL